MATENRIQVALVDDHPIFRDGVAQLLGAQPDMVVVGEGGCAEEALALALDRSPDLILLDIHMPGGGVEAARAIADRCPEVKVLMLTGSEEEEDVEEAFRAGALGYILKGVTARELVAIVRSAYSGICYVAPAVAGRK